MIFICSISTSYSGSLARSINCFWSGSVSNYFTKYLSFTLLQVCGKRFKSPSRHRRVVGGKEATPYTWPWIALILFSDGKHICGGTLVKKNWLVTAASCFGKTRPGIIIIISRNQLVDLLIQILPSDWLSYSLLAKDSIFKFKTIAENVRLVGSW